MAAAVREAVPADAPALARLRYGFRAELGGAEEPEAAFVDRAARWMAARLVPGSPWRAWVAVAGDGAAVGCVWLQLVEKVPNPGAEEELHGYVTSVYVAPGWRGTGIGGALLDAAMAACRAAQVDSVILWPTPASRGMYERRGFAAPDDLLELRLGTGRGLP